MITYVAVFGLAILYTLLFLVSLFHKSNSWTMKLIRVLSLPVISLFIALAVVAGGLIMVVDFVLFGTKAFK
jgi:hypothetical protein